MLLYAISPCHIQVGTHWCQHVRVHDALLSWKKASFDSLKFRAADWWHAVKINTVDKLRNGVQWDGIQTGTKPWRGSQIKLKSYLHDGPSHGSPAGSETTLHQGHSWWIFPSVKAGCVCAACCREGCSIQFIFSLYISKNLNPSGCFTCFSASPW